MARISAVVPAYNVEAYLEECLRSLAEQTASDLQVVIVDDGSTDRTGEIAEGFARRDRRFELVRQRNAGLGAARNAGIAAARGEYLAFVDGDDRLPPRAYELLLHTLDRTGSDFATGAVHRYDGSRSWPAPFLAKTFWRTRTRTHVTRFRWLISDRVAWNKLWRRSFWDAQGLRFPEGVLHEDIPVVVPAHFLARAVDVVRRPVYLYRERADGAQSITQRRTDPETLRARVAAIEQVERFLDEQGPPGARRWYDESVASDDLRYHLDALDAGDDEYRELFLDLANEFLARAGPGVEDPLPAIQRLKWQLVRRRALPELLEVLRFQQTELRSNPKVWIHGRAYGDYPFLGDPRLNIPRSVYRLDTGRRRLRHLATLARG
jgi:CDP-glycerol glycerophosphotransferase